jgi:hypothetical protein
MLRNVASRSLIDSMAIRRPPVTPLNSRKNPDGRFPICTAYTTTSQRLAVSRTALGVRKLRVSTPSVKTIISDRPTSDSPIMMPAKLASTSDVCPDVSDCINAARTRAKSDVSGALCATR